MVRGITRSRFSVRLSRCVVVRTFCKLIDTLFFSGHIFSLRGQKWRNLRAKLTPTFTSGKMKAMFPHFVDIAGKFQDVLMPLADERKVRSPFFHFPCHIYRSQVVDVKELAACYATDLTTLTAFGITTQALTDPKEPFRIKGKKVFRPSFFTIVRSLMPFLVPEFAKLIGVSLFLRFH